MAFSKTIFLLFTFLFFSHAATQNVPTDPSAEGARQLGRPISIFDFRFRIAPANLALEQPMQFRSLFLFVAALYNNAVIQSETGVFVNGSEPLQRIPADPFDLGVRNAAIAVAIAVRVSGLGVAQAISDIGSTLFLDLPVRLEDLKRDNPDFENLRIGFEVTRDALAELADKDGFNEFGKDDGSVANLMPFEDLTGFKPINSPENIVDLRRWTPLIVNPNPRVSFGTFVTQRFPAPQAAFVDTILLRPAFANAQALADPYRMRIPRRATCDPRRLRRQNRLVRRLCSETAEVIRKRANLTDRQKAIAAYYDNLGRLGMLIRFIPLNRMLSIDDAFTYLYLADAGMYELTLLVWRDLRRTQTVRPVTLIQNLYKDVRIAGEDGPILGQDFDSFVRTPPYPEFPSLHAAMCQYFADVSELALGTSSIVIDDVLFDGTAVPAGPFADINFPVLDIRIRDVQTDIADACSESRINTGVNLRSSVEAGRRLGRAVAQEYIRRMACIAPNSAFLPPCEDRGHARQ